MTSNVTDNEEEVLTILEQERVALREKETTLHNKQADRQAAIDRQTIINMEVEKRRAIALAQFLRETDDVLSL